MDFCEICMSSDEIGWLAEVELSFDGDDLKFKAKCLHENVE